VRLQELRLQNWGPYKGEQVLDLRTSPSAPVVLVHGENMRGKTSLLRALRWALYGVVHAHDGSEIPIADFANYDVRDAGAEFDFGVTLRFEDRGRDLEITRTARGKVRPGLAGPEVEVTREAPLMRVVGGNPIAERDISEFVQRILHPEISDFFLFDGEMLARFEERLRGGDTSAVFVRRRIEMALGVPALRQARADVNFLYDETSAAVRRAATAQKHSKTLSDQLQAVEQSIRRASDDLAGLREAEREASALASDLEQQLARVDAIKEAYYKRVAAQANYEEYARDQEGYREELRSKLDALWWLPMSTRLRQKALAAQDAWDEHIELARSRAALDGELAIAQKQVHETTCRTCRQPIPEDRLAGLQENVTALERQLSNLPPLADGTVLAEQARSLRKFLSADAVVEQVQSLEKDIKRAGLRAASEKSTIEALTQSIEGNDIDIAALEKNLQNARLTEREAQEHITDVEKQLSSLQRQQADFTKQLAETSPGNEGLRAELQVLDELRDCVDEAIAGFRNNMRKRVQDEASAIFRDLTTEPDYAGLRIDGNYYLNIVDDRDRVINRRSAGADQIVTMSLIGALAKCSVEEGPIVMDTPFGRLDRGHRNKILQWVATLGTQAVLFVQSGEFERDRDLGTLNGRVGREYLLKRLGATSTRLEAIRAD